MMKPRTDDWDAPMPKVVTMFREHRMNTLTIAKKLNITEAAVTNTILEWRERDAKRRRESALPLVRNTVVKLSVDDPDKIAAAMRVVRMTEGNRPCRHFS